MGVKNFLVSLLRAKFPWSRVSIMSVVGEKSLSLQALLNGSEELSSVLVEGKVPSVKIFSNVCC